MAMLGLHSALSYVLCMHIPNMIADWIHRTHCDWYSTLRLFGVVLCKTVRSIDDYQRNVVWWKYMKCTYKYIYIDGTLQTFGVQDWNSATNIRRVIVGAREKITPFLYKSTDLTFIVRGAVVKWLMLWFSVKFCSIIR